MKLSELIPRARLWLVLACLAAILASGAGAPSLSFTNDSRVFFSQDNPERTALERLEQSFNVAQTALLAIAPKGGITAGTENAALSIPALEVLADAVRLARGLPDIAAIDSPLSTALPRWAAGRLEVSPLLSSDGALDDAAARRIRDEPLFRGWLISADGNVALYFKGSGGFVGQAAPDLASTEDVDESVVTFLVTCGNRTMSRDVCNTGSVKLFGAGRGSNSGTYTL